jgi:hypothetical protein
MQGFVRYFRDVSCRAIKSAWTILGIILGILTPFSRYIGGKYPDLGATVNNALWIIPLCAFFFLLFTGFFVAGYNINKEQEKKITDLQKQLFDSKQDIRTFLESIHPEILQMVDEGQKEICVGLGDLKQTELADLYERPDFGRFLLFRKCEGSYNYVEPGETMIIELGQGLRYVVKYYFYPKKALIEQNKPSKS